MEKYYHFLFRKPKVGDANRDIKNDISAVLVAEEDKVVGISKSYYSTLTTDEVTARIMLTMTGHLPSEKFEMLMDDAKGIAQEGEEIEDTTESTGEETIIE